MIPEQLGKRHAVIVVAITAAVVVAPVTIGAHLTTAPTAAQQGPPDQATTYSYSAKFLCGTMEGPDRTRAADEPAVKPGNYATDIDIHNFGDEPAELDLTIHADSGRSQSSSTRTVRVDANSATQIPCREIVRALGERAITAEFVKGFVEIESDTEVAVAAIYTSKSVEVRTDAPDVGVDLNLSTGVDETNGIFIPDGDEDDDWVLVAGPTVDDPRPAVVVNESLDHVQNAYPNGHDGRSPDGSKLISTDPGAFEDPPRAKFTYVRTFTLPTDAKNPKLDLTLNPDDSADVYLNGKLLHRGIGTSMGETTVTASSGFVAGENRLKVVVQESGTAVTSLGLNGHVTADIAGSVGTGTGMSTHVEYIEPRVIRGQPGGGNGNDGGTETPTPRTETPDTPTPRTETPDTPTPPTITVNTETSDGSGEVTLTVRG